MRRPKPWARDERDYPLFPWRGWLPTAAGQLPSGDRFTCWILAVVALEDV